jgi:hypothetical protein
MIIVIGDSWAAGEWSRGDLYEGEQKVTHGGLGQYIQESGLACTTLCNPGAGNYASAFGLECWFERNQNQKVDSIFVFQTDYARDSAMVFEEDYDIVEHENSVANIIISRFYHRLIEISRRYGPKIYLVGGSGDTLSSELVKKHYSPLEVACQSMTNFLINDNDQINDPILSLYKNDSLMMIEKIKKKLSDSKLLTLFDKIDQGIKRETQIFSHPDYFWPDGIHPNRLGHKKLFDFLWQKGLIS